ncbi:MAG TPA: nucleoside diphosphate kinase regulator [Elusimicrobiota bacterium]|nr:nucleoside diphosphate kinase regulator [Elusimicrobiota bacterium]
MKEKTICLTETDAKRLNDILHGAQRIDPMDNRHVQALRGELARGRIVPPGEIPENVITMNSRVRIKDLDSGEETVYTLVYPKDANIEEGKLSVLAPIGTALLGYQAGDIIEWLLPAGVLRRLKIKKVVFQPEAVGDYFL